MTPVAKAKREVLVFLLVQVGLLLSGCVFHLVTLQVFPGGSQKAATATTQKAEVETAEQEQRELDYARWLIGGPGR